MPRPAVLDLKLKAEADAILLKHGITYDGYAYKVPKVHCAFSWDRSHVFHFFTHPDRLNGCCGVIEMQQCCAPNSTFPKALTEDEWTTLFKSHVRDVLHRFSRRMGLVTLIASQRRFVPFLQSAGFKKVSEGFNPGTRRKVTVWALSI